MIRYQVLFLIFITLLLNFNGLDSPFILDDLFKIVNNPDIKNFDLIYSKLIYPYEVNQSFERNDPSRPLVYFIFSIIYHFFDKDPFYYHIVNLMLHILNGILVLFTIKALLEKLKIKDDFNILAFFTALFFLIHPVSIGTVIYAYALHDVLSSTFILLCFNFYLKNKTKKHMLFSLAFFILGLMTKQILIIMPLIFYFYETLILKTRLKKSISNISLFLVVLGLYLLSRYFYFGSIGDLEARNITQDRLEYFLIQSIVILKYIYLVLFPIGQSIDHELIINNYSLILKILIYLILIGIPIFLLFKRKLEILFIYLFYFINLLPTSSFFPTVDFMVERRMYLANVSLFFGISFLLVHFINIQNIKIKFLILILSILPFAFLTFQRNIMFHSAETIWLETLNSYPKNIRALNNLGTFYLNQLQFEKAKNMYEKILENPIETSTYKNNISIFYSNLAFIHFYEKSNLYDLEKAKVYLSKAITSEIVFYKAYFYLAQLQIKENNFKEAKSNLINCLTLYPNYNPALELLSKLK